MSYTIEAYMSAAPVEFCVQLQRNDPCLPRPLWQRSFNVIATLPGDSNVTVEYSPRNRGACDVTVSFDTERMTGRLLRWVMLHGSGKFSMQWHDPCMQRSDAPQRACFKFRQPVVDATSDAALAGGTQDMVDFFKIALRDCGYRKAVPKAFRFQQLSWRGELPRRDAKKVFDHACDCAGLYGISTHDDKANVDWDRQITGYPDTEGSVKNIAKRIYDVDAALFNELSK